MAIQIQLRRGNSNQWTLQNPILAQGELAVELDTSKFKIGDGIKTWNQLPYVDNQNKIGFLTDVYAVDPDDGSVLVYNASINKWVATVELNQQTVSMDGGFF
jgi:hypothetical protein